MPPHTDRADLLPRSWWLYSVEQIAALAPIEIVDWPDFEQKNITVAIKRDDRLDPSISGNKFYKLFGHIAAFRASPHTQWLTFGGAYSNHLLAFAEASAQLGIPAIAIIRGEQPKVMSQTLVDALALGVRLVFVSRSGYRDKENPAQIARWRNQFSDFYCVPEGGGGALGALGCAAWAEQALVMSPWVPTTICLAAGTGCSAAGVLSAAGTVPVHAYLALKGDADHYREFTQEVTTLALETAKLRGSSRQLPALVLEAGYHCGGYARLPGFLREFMYAFEAQTQVPLDPVYTAKMIWGITEQVRAGFWPRGSRLLVLHSGGLQGRRGYRDW